MTSHVEFANSKFMRLNPHRGNGTTVLRERNTTLENDGWLGLDRYAEKTDTIETMELAIDKFEKRLERQSRELTAKAHHALMELIELSQARYRRACLMHGGGSPQASILNEQIQAALSALAKLG
jgi:hypothetical protein